MSIASEYMHAIIMAYSYAIEKFHEATREITKAEWFDITPRYDLARIKMLQKDAEEKANHIADLYPYLYEELERDLIFMRHFYYMQDEAKNAEDEFWIAFDRYLKRNHLYDNRSEYWDRREVMESILED